MGFGNDCGPKPDDPVEAAIWTFATFSNWGMLHPYDDERFDEFVRVAISKESRWQASDVEKRLLKYGLPAELAHSLGERFWTKMQAVPEVPEGVRELKAKLANRGREPDDVRRTPKEPKA